MGPWPWSRGDHRPSPASMVLTLSIIGWFAGKTWCRSTVYCQWRHHFSKLKITNCLSEVLVSYSRVPHFVLNDIWISKFMHCMTLEWQPERIEKLYLTMYYFQLFVSIANWMTLILFLLLFIRTPFWCPSEGHQHGWHLHTKLLKNGGHQARLWVTSLNLSLRSF